MNIDITKMIDYCYEVITFEIFIKFIIIYFFVIWVAILLWVIKDITNRTDNVYLQVISIFIILFLTPLGIFIYLLIRPGKTLFEKYYNEIEDNLDIFNSIVEEKNKQVGNELSCFKCNEPVNHDFKFCPKCKVGLKNECTKCKKLLFFDWKTCPYCGTKNKNEKKKK